MLIILIFYLPVNTGEIVADITGITTFPHILADADNTAYRFDRNHQATG